MSKLHLDMARTRHAKAKRKAALAAALDAYHTNPCESLLLVFPAPLRGWTRVVRQLSTEPALLESIRLSLFPNKRAQIQNALVSLFEKHTGRELADPWSAFLGHCTQYVDIVPKVVLQAVADFRTARNAYLSMRKRLIKICRLDNSGDGAAECTARRERRLEFLESHCTVVRVKRLEEPYPPPQEWVVETPEIGEKWQQWCATHKLSDIREGYFPVHHIDAAKLQHTVKENASELIIDADTKELLAVVIRSWCAEQPVIEAIAAYIADSPNIQRNARVSVF